MFRLHTQKEKILKETINCDQSWKFCIRKCCKKQTNSQNSLTRQFVHVTYCTTLTSNMASGSCANTPSPDHFRPMLASLPTLLCEQSSSGTIHAIQYCSIGLVGVKKTLCQYWDKVQKPHIWSYRKIIDREEARKNLENQVSKPEGLSKDEMKS